MLFLALLAPFGDARVHRMKKVLFYILVSFLLRLAPQLTFSIPSTSPKVTLEA